MDDVARESLPNTLPIQPLSRKRKADSDDPDVNNPSTSSPQLSSPDARPGKLVDPCTAAPRLSLETSPRSPPRSWFTPASSAGNTPLPSPSTSPPMSAMTSSPDTDTDAPPRPKRPRIDTAPPSATDSRRPSSRRAQDLITALQSQEYKGSWQWATSSSGESRLVALSPVSSASLSADPAPTSFPSSPADVIYIDPCSPHIPLRAPPINKDTLKELDLDAIMRNPQLRHDFLFDSGLQFRAAASRRKREQADTYWRAILVELETGCTCVTFDVRGRPHSCQCVCRKLPTAPAVPVIACLPMRRRLTLRMPSRIKTLLHELLQVLLSIIRPQSTSTSTVQGNNVSLQQRLQQHHEQAQQLRDVLDADLIEQEMKHGLYEPSSTFRVIGEVLKAHCAPMRDQAVDRMVALAMRCRPEGEGTKADAVEVMRQCFEILELMKLDIANHQMQTLRPFIIHSSPEFELRTFKERHNRGPSPLLLTRQWLTQAHQRLEASQYSLSYPARAFPYSSLGKRTHVILSTLKGLIDLVFAPLSPVPLSSPPVTTTMPSNQSVPTVVSQLSGYPETLYLDHSRLILLTRDAADLTAIYALLMLYRQLVFSSSPSTSNPRRDVSLDHADLQRLKLEIWEIGPPNLGRCFLHPAAGAQAPPSPSQNEKEKELQRWDDALKAVALQLTARATEARCAPTKTPVSPTLPVCAPDEHLLKTAESWVDSHLKTDSALTALMRNRLRDAVFDSVVSTVLIRGSMTPAALAPEVKQEPGTATGLEPLAPEIRQLSERVSKLAVLHLNVYQTLYEEDELSADW